MRFLKKLFQRLRRKSKNRFVIIYNVNHKDHRFTFNLQDKAESSFELLADMVIKSAESCKINEGIVSLFIDGIIERQVSFTGMIGLQSFIRKEGGK